MCSKVDTKVCKKVDMRVGGDDEGVEETGDYLLLLPSGGGCFYRPSNTITSPFHCLQYK